MTKDNIVLKWLAIFLAIVWLGTTGWLNFDAFAGRQGYERPEVQAKLSNCDGTFKQRYECKSSQIISEGRSTFLDLALRSAIIFAPPLLLWAAWSQLPDRRRRHRRTAH